ncbi:hypothetical protein Ddc_13596 [Ditylenchus destructor]|nr:hypothetical protein Ddc_13596 [Ditylenchus destructor]
MTDKYGGWRENVRKEAQKTAGGSRPVFCVKPNPAKPSSRANRASSCLIPAKYVAFFQSAATKKGNMCEVKDPSWNKVKLCGDFVTKPLLRKTWTLLTLRVDYRGAWVGQRTHLRPGSRWQQCGKWKPLITFSPALLVLNK